MEIVHVISGSLHILSAVTWIGSMIYSEFGVKPALKNLGDIKAHSVNGNVMKKFSVLTWISLIILILTGIYAIYSEKDKLTPVFEESSGIVLLVKLILVAAMIIILFLQVFVYGPKMQSLISTATPQNRENQKEMIKTTNISKTLSKIHLYVGIIIVILAVILSQLLEK
ncbi:MAG: DUF4149 domain-containing protein [Vulcanibacillus sp.]